MKQKKSTTWEIVNSLWILPCFFIGLLSWASFIYIGRRVAKRKYVLWGIVYTIPVIAISIGVSASEHAGDPYYDMVDDIAGLVFFISWIASILHAFIIRKEYLVLLSQKEESQNFGRQYEENYRQVAAATTTNPHDKVLEKAKTIAKQIDRYLKENEDATSYLFDEIKPLVKKYLTQIELLIEQYKKMQQLAKGIPAEQLKIELQDLEIKLQSSDNQVYKTELRELIAKKKKYRNSGQELKEQAEIIQIRIKAAVLSLQQIKMDLLNIEHLSNRDRQKEVFKNLEEKADDISSYIQVLEETYSNLDM